MTKKTLTAIAALAAVVILTAAYFGIQAWRRANPPPSPWDSFVFEGSPLLADFDAAKINRIENFTQAYALTRDGEGDWILVSENVNADKINISQTSISGRLWIYSNILSESLIEENPDDISIFGLDNPLGHVLIGDSDGKTVEFIIGNINPSRTAYYVMLAGQPEVYTISPYITGNLNFSLDSIRERELLRYMEPDSVSHFILEYRPGDNFYEKGSLEVTLRSEENPFISFYCSYLLNSPYAGTYGVDQNGFIKLMESLTYLELIEYVDDDPSSLETYGLDRPGRIYVNSDTGVFEMLYGRTEAGLRYAKFPDGNSVFTVDGLSPILDTAPFSLMDKFILIHDIDDIDRFTVTTEGRTLTGAIQGKGDDAIFHFNGRRASAREFRIFYQNNIGLLIDAELTGPETRGEGADILIEYFFNNPAGFRTSVRLIPHNRDFYVVEKQGIREFLLARTQVRRIFDSADNMVYADAPF